MTEIILLILVLYTALLISLGRSGRRNSPDRNFIHGGRQFSAWQVFFMISSLWCSWIFIVELETAYLFGVSAVWFGVAFGIVAVLGVYKLINPFRKLGFLTNSGLIGEKFGLAARIIAGAVIALTFPVFAMSNVLAAAAFLHVVLGLPLMMTLIGSLLVILAYVILGGIWALAYTQIVNFTLMSIGLVIGVIFALHAVPFPMMIRELPPRYFVLNGAGNGIILVWLATALLNMISAQAEFQILTAARDMASARRGLFWSLMATIVFCILAPVIGIAVRVHEQNAKALGVIAFPDLFVQTAPEAVVVLMTLCVWAAALTWSAPLMFSGACSAGVDVIGPLLRKVSRVDQRLLVQLCLPVQALLIIGYAVLRPEELAWWQILGLTIRNGALFAPTIAIVLWPVATGIAGIISMLGGCVSGLLWNYMTDFSATKFLLGVNPMWIGAAVGIALLTVITLMTSWPKIRFYAGSASRGILFLLGLVGVFLLSMMIGMPAVLIRTGMLGPDLLALSLDCLAIASLVVAPKCDVMAVTSVVG